jgi:hypothetical protein
MQASHQNSKSAKMDIPNIIYTGADEEQIAVTAC